MKCVRKSNPLLMWCISILILFYILPDLTNSGHEHSEANPEEHQHHAISRTVDNKIIKVIIIAYYRGGSSFVGEILNQNRQAFYVYEPLFHTFHDIKKRQKLPLGGDIYVPWNFTFRSLGEEEDNRIASIAISLLNCDLDSLPENLFTHRFLAEYHEYVLGPLIKQYRQCMLYQQKTGQTKAQFKKNQTAHWEDNLHACLPVLQESCDQSRIRGLKTIRMTISQIVKVLHLDSDVKVIFSTRDPRGIANSRYAISSVDKRIKRTLVDTIKEVCARVKNDLETLNHLHPLMKSRIMTTSFENILGNPVGEIRKLFKFMGVQQPKEVQRWVKRQVRNKEKGNAVMEKWRGRGENSNWWQVSECKDILGDA